MTRSNLDLIPLKLVDQLVGPTRVSSVKSVRALNDPPRGIILCAVCSEYFHLHQPGLGTGGIDECTVGA
jgi:hypothetical protein